MQRALAVLLSTFALAGCWPAWPGVLHAAFRFQPNQPLRVESVQAGGTSFRAGLRQGDQVLAIDNVEVSGLTDNEATERLRGEVGTRVRLRVQRGDDTREVVVERAPPR